MKHIFFLLLFTLSLFGNDFIEDFLSKEVALEIQLEDQNLSSDALESTIDEEDKLFKHFFVDYITKDVGAGELEQNPYSSEIFRLKRRMQANSQRGNTLALMRDELKLATLSLKQNIRNSMEQVVEASKLESYKAFKERMQEIIAKRHEKEPQIDLQKFAFLKEAVAPEALTQSALENLDEYRYILNIHNNLSTELTENMQMIYSAGAAYRYGVLSLAVKINDSVLGRAVDPYLEYVYLSGAKLVYIIAILLCIYVARKLIFFALHRLVYFVSRDKEDIGYIFEKISRP
ncbi:MAG: hypothetical protein MUP09_07800, partial [Thiovulaceae bacterium]|nr:hypothetical protein [Sulfurimonadaceae bacterium]